MAWLTKIIADEQVEYRLTEQAGCAVVEGQETDAVDAFAGEDRAVDYRLNGALVWMGSGLDAVGLVEGAVLDEEGKAAARRLMAGCHPETGTRLVTSRTAARAHESAQLTTARLVEAIVAAAEEKGVTAAGLFADKPKQLRVFEAQRRNVHRFGETHRMQVVTLHKVARAAGVDLADVYGETELATAWANKDRRVDDRVRGWDLVLDLPKSDSLVSALLDELGADAFRDLVHEAKRDTFRQLERWAGYAVGSADGEPVRLAAGGLLAWSVEHQSARPVHAGEPGDPHFHLHVTIANMARCEDGAWRSVANSGQDFHRHASAADAYFKARVRALTYEKFGARRELNERTGAWEIRGIPEQMRAAFSRRAALVDAKAGADAPRTEKQAASMATKRDKLDADAATMRESWRTRAEAVVGDVDAMLAAAVPGPPPGPGSGTGPDGPNGPQIPPPSDIAAIVFDPKTGLTAHEKTFRHAQLLAAVANALEYGIDSDPDRLELLCDAVLDAEGYAVRVPSTGSLVLSSNASYTTQDILAAEATVRAHALDRFGSGTVQLTADEAAAAVGVFQVAAGFELSAEQTGAVTRVLTGGHGIDAFVGVAGAGKSTLMEACRIGWDATGTTYAGATLAAVAAQQLRDASGIPARTIAAWAAEIETGAGLRGIDVLVVDEAGMVDDRAAALLMTEAARTGTKVVALGDRLQLQAVAAGGWFGEVHRVVGGLALTENRRQEDAAERAALEVWRTGDHQLALELLAAGGRVHAAETAEEARSQILTTWDELRQARWPDPQDLIQHLVVLAARNGDVDALNLGAQQIRRAAGDLGGEHTYALPGGSDLTLAEGDIVRVRQNDYRSRRGQGADMLNGYRAVITKMSEDRRVEISWRVKDAKAPGGLRTESGWVTPDQIASGTLSLGYAMTVAASQGLTCDTSLMYGHGANAFSTYPGITRARRENHIWLPLAVLEDEQTQARLGAARSEKERLERAIDAFAKFLGQSRPDHMVSDLLHEPPAPAQLQRDIAAEEARADTDRKLRRRLVDAVDAVDVPRPRPHDQAEEEPHSHHHRLTGLTDEQTAKLRLLQEEREVPPWPARRYGDLTDPALSRMISTCESAAADAERVAREHEHIARAIEERLDREAAAGQTCGQQYTAEAAGLLDQAEDLMATVHRELDTAANSRMTAEERTRWLADLGRAEDKGWLTLRLAGTSRKEQRALSQEYTAERTAAWNEHYRAAQAARDTHLDAWNLIRDSKFANVFGAGRGQAVPDPRTTTERLSEMRSAATRAGHSIDVRDRQRIGWAAGQAATHRKKVADLRAQAAAGRTETDLRSVIGAKYPALHQQETAARQELSQKRQAEQRQQAAQRAEQARTRAPAPYTSPPAERRGPGRSF